MKLGSFKEKFKRSYQRFSDGTSMHGFTELFYAKTVFWKMVWFLIVLGAICVTIYQVTQAINNYINQTSSTLIQPATADQIRYPPLKFCIAHWIYWINWDKLFEIGFTKETILYGMSFLTDIYSKQHFNVSEAANSFTSMLKHINITNLTDFYKTFGTAYFDFGDPDIFESTEFVIADLSNPYFCHTVSGDSIKSYLTTKKNGQSSVGSQQNMIALKWNSIIQSIIDPDEYNSYMANWVYNKTTQYYLNEENELNGDYTKVHNNYSLVIPPNIMFVDGYSDTYVKLLPQYDEYFITVKASSRRWKNTKTNKCNEKMVSVLSDVSCSINCEYLSQECLYATNGYNFVTKTALKNNTYPFTLVRCEIHFLNETNQETSFSPTFNEPIASSFSMFRKENFTTSPKQQKNMLSTTLPVGDENNTVSTSRGADENNNDRAQSELCNFTERENTRTACVAENCKMLGCELWTFDITVTTRSLYDIVKEVAYKRSAQAYINYPMNDDVLIMTETDSKTWEDFVGNVGGLFGIWTGASVISLFQIFYLCCCVEKQGGHFSFAKWWKRQRSRNDVEMGEISNIKRNQPNPFTTTRRKRPLKRIKTVIVKPYDVITNYHDGHYSHQNRSRTTVMKIENE